MPASRSVVSVLVRFVVRSFSTNSRPALRAAASGGCPRPATRRYGTTSATVNRFHLELESWLWTQSYRVTLYRPTQDTTKVWLCAVEKSTLAPAVTLYDATACRTSPPSRSIPQRR